MQRIPHAMRLYVEQKAPRFVEAVDHAAKEMLQEQAEAEAAGEAAVRTTLPLFRGDLALTYGCLWYAATKQVSVVFVTSASRASGGFVPPLR